MKRTVLFVITLIFIFVAAGCANGEYSASNHATKAFSRFLKGDRSLLAQGQETQWDIPDFKGTDLKYEYTYLDLDRDGTVELLIQLQNDPCGYNGVFHFDGENIICWNSDPIEGSCRDYPLKNGVMVRQYDYSGTRTYSLFNYIETGEKAPVSEFLARDELIYPDSALKCPYYEIDRTEIDKDEFEKQLKSVISDQLIERDKWKEL